MAIIPNMMSFANVQEEELLGLYKKIIDKLIVSHDVYLLRHSKEDIEGCRQIANFFGDHDRLHLMLDDMNCFELEDVLSQFEFCIASRFHSIIHSYKNGTPCVVLGWAEKYKDLLEGFEQTQYLFDVHNLANNEEKILNSIDQLEQNYVQERKVIEKCLTRQQKSNAFDRIKEDIDEFNG